MKTEYKTSILGQAGRKKKRERTERKATKRKKKKKCKREERVETYPSTCRIFPIYSNLVSRFSIEYAGRHLLICRKMIVPDDGWLSVLRRRTLSMTPVFVNSSHARNQDEPAAYGHYTCCAVAYWIEHVSSAHVRQLPKRETIVSFLRWVFVSLAFDYRHEQRRPNTYDCKKNLRARSVVRFAWPSKFGRNVIEFGSGEEKGIEERFERSLNEDYGQGRVRMTEF